MSNGTSNWWMFHGDLAHTGEASGSTINSGNVSGLKLTQSIDVPGSILSTPAVVDGFVYVGLANSLQATDANGGLLLKIDLATGKTAASFPWATDKGEGDSHGFFGMGCTPAVVDGCVYFSAFDGKAYCLDQQTLALKWVTNLRQADPDQNQPVNNDNGAAPKAAGWSSPAVLNGRVYIGMGEGENQSPGLYSFVYCLDAGTGKVIWIYCTCQYVDGTNNAPNQLPKDTLENGLPAGFTEYDGQPVALGASVWSGIAVDPDLDALYCATGNPQPDNQLPTLGYTNGILVLSASTGAFKAFVQIPAETSYRASDVDIDIGGAPTLYTLNGKKVVGVGCKNGCFMVLDATTYKILQTRQMLPKMKDGSQIPTVDPHGIDDPSQPNPVLTNDQSNQNQAENFHGTYSTAATCSQQQKLFIGIGGNNYHYICAGIDTKSTPFIRAMKMSDLTDAWPLDNGDPQRYAAASDPKNPLYKNAGESGISVPAVVNDVVFMSTTLVALYAFNAKDGSLLWSDAENFGAQTGGMSGGYGYCMGPAIVGNYVVAGALVQGGNGGVLNIYALPS